MGTSFDEMTEQPLCHWSCCTWRPGSDHHQFGLKPGKRRISIAILDVLTDKQLVALGRTGESVQFPNTVQEEAHHACKDIA